MTEKRTAEEFLKTHGVIQTSLLPGSAIELAMHQYAAQELAEHKAKLKECIVDRINKAESERRECTPGSDAYILMLGHKYEATKILELIDKL